MKILMTWTGDGKNAGTVYDLPDKEAQKYLDEEKAIIAFNPPVEPKKKKVTNDENKS